MKPLRDKDGNQIVFLPTLLRALREQTGVSKKYLATKLRMTQQQYYQLEEGIVYPPASDVTGVYRNLAKIYGIDEQTLLVAAENERIRRRLYKDFKEAFRLLDSLATGYLERKKEGYTASKLLEYAIKNAPHK